MEASVIDLFCGIGGLSYGLAESGLKVVAGIDFDSACEYAYKENVGGEFLSMDICDLSGAFIKEKYWIKNEEVRILVGCAPCQPFSPHSNKNRQRKNSSQWHLLNEFKRIVEETEPDIISMENVPNLTNQIIFRELIDHLKSQNYYTSYSTIYCPDYGIPQKRRRLVLLASKYGEISIIPKTHSVEKYVTLKQAISHLPPVGAGEIIENDPLHRTRNLTAINIRRIKASKPNGSWLDWGEELQLACHKKPTGRSYKSVYGRMSWDEPSPTITTQFYNYGTGRFGHPTQNRAITIREAALLQSFPPEYKFCEDERNTSITKLGVHIGNAVPVALAFAIGKSIQSHLEKHRE